MPVIDGESNMAFKNFEQHDDDIITISVDYEIFRCHQSLLIEHSENRTWAKTGSGPEVSRKWTGSELEVAEIRNVS